MALHANTDWRRTAAESVAVFIGVALFGCALGADRQWLDRHFLPPFFVTRQIYTASAAVVRVLMAVAGVILAVIVPPRIGRFVASTPTHTLMADLARILLAIALALGTGEMILRFTFRQSSEEQPSTQVPYRRLDPRLGWVFVPSRTGRDTAAGRMIEYAFDAAGYRVRQSDQHIDPDKETILFTGESIMVGQGLTWEETVPAQVEKLLGIQSANLAVHGFANDQAYLRLQAELPRFQKPVAIVSLFSPGLFDRNLDDDRPHLGPDLAWQPAKPRWRLLMIASWLMPYRSTDAIEQGIETTRAVLRATADLAHSRGAASLIVVPQFTPEDPTETVLRQRILDEARLPYVWVKFDPAWRLPVDRHPDARAASAMAVALADQIRSTLDWAPAPKPRNGR